MTTTNPADVIRGRFQYWETIPPLYPERNENNIRHAYRGHWFDPDTLRCFGSRNREMVAEGMMIELQTKAPESVPRYSVTAWIIDDNGRPDPIHLARFTTRRAADKWARAAAAIWPEVTK